MFLGAHCITMYSNEIYFVVMKNVFPPDVVKRCELSEIYDLKGSWVHRNANRGSRQTRRERAREQLESANANPPLYLDNDLKQKIILRPGVAQALLEQAKRDAVFLSGVYCRVLTVNSWYNALPFVCLLFFYL